MIPNFVEGVRAAMGASANDYGTAGDESLEMRDLARTSYKGLIVALHGRNLTAQTWGPSAGSAYDHVRALMQAGYVVVAIDAAGIQSWSNPACMAAIDAAVTVAFARFSLTKLALLGYSMGGIESLNYLKRHSDKTLGLAAFAALTDLSFEYAPAAYYPTYDPHGVAPIATAQAEINTAFACTTATYAAATAGYRIADEYNTWKNLRPVQLFHAYDDATVPLDQALAFVRGVNDPNVKLFATPSGGHGNFAQIPTSKTVKFFDSLAWS